MLTLLKIFQDGLCKELFRIQPFCSHCKVAANNLAAVDLPLPGGPVNNQAWEKPGITFPVKASFESAEFHTKVNQAFRDLAKANPDRYIVIDASKPIDEIADLVFNAFKAKRK